MAFERNAKGRDGENRAAAFLESTGYSIVRRNVRIPGGEIDLVCRDGATIVFVEVKRRDTQAFGSALSAVGPRKRATLRRIAADYMQIVAPGSHFRFDVVALDGDRLTLYRDVF